MPYLYLPHSRLYQIRDALPEGMTDCVTMRKDPSRMPSLQQRLVLQTEYVDCQISRLLDQLTSTRMLQRSMLVVLSYHGISFEPRYNRRAPFKLDQVNRHEVLPVPLFIKYPNQPSAVVYNRPRDRLRAPHYRHALVIRLPPYSHVDGVSLPAGRSPHVTPGSTTVVRAST